MSDHKPKIFVLLPDGVGLRNFAFTDFKEIGEQMGFEVVFWNNTIFPLQEELGFKEVVISNAGLHPLTGVLSRARKRVELSLSRKRTNDKVYDTYKFPLRWKGIKEGLKNLIVFYYQNFRSSKSGLEKLLIKIDDKERSTDRYKELKSQLEEHEPVMVFSTTQRATMGIAPILAAKDLGIKTATWVYSWDNLPKGMSTITTDAYFVWSELMKKELLEYYPETKNAAIHITGTPQFEPHYNEGIIKTKEAFFKDHSLDLQKRYFCFSGDDYTTSPLDQYYLEDCAQAVEKLNSEGYNLGIIYRKVPVDFTGRYDAVLEKYKDVITSIEPLWKPVGKEWNQIMPTKEDFERLVNTCFHSEFVVNIGSSMVFDFAIHGKSCIYPNYEQPQLTPSLSNIKHVYEYVHFRSMPDVEKAVIWAKSKSEIYECIKDLLDQKISSVVESNDWFEVVNHPESPEKASERIWDGIKEMVK
ncbi:hypothetical protein LY01_01847 [Nonlabens xylanidelens]|uniref:UDP-glycosyltransferase n=1 Tax=Nonlabens xylanidelens TaxID=191564 RepID=A0A2S6ILI7_9FLAO|nr:UDP-glycosyltransferase [Nonlabens xylanidelens]PPK95094.1 hypothetical protein LY01_01847 [Nonlabens xylanidelens]PQJ17624.1 UDP-glycosyltransferase [Nonlabens xylanidelens]